MGPKGNVVPLGSHPRAKSRLTPQESASVLKGCRELALDRMAQVLSGMLDRVEDELFELADKAPERDAQNLYLDARTQARANRAAMEAAFRQHFVECFNLKVLGEPPPSAEPEAELALVDEEELERRLAMEEMSRQLGAKCEKELFALSQRMGFLLERPDLEDDANPVSPATICAALKDAVDQIQSDYKVRMALLRSLTRLAENELDRVYHDLNALLVERRILPDVRPAVRRSPSAVPRRPNATAAAEGLAPTADLFSTLAQLVAPAAGAAAGTPPAPAAPAAFVSELTRLHRELPAPGAGAAPVNVLRDLKAAPREGELSHVDAATIDIVAMLFDYTFEDADIPASVKALLARLQIPVLKVALLDRGFFSSDAHPARRLIDLLAQVGIGLDEHDERGRAALALIGNVVDTVVRDFETEVAFFSALVARVEAFVAEQDRAEAELVERSARLVEARERDEIARLVAEEEVARRLRARMWAPAPVREMLLGTWVRALASVQQAEGEGSPAWQSLVHTMDDLLWSVEPKSTPDERKRLVVMLPAMLRRMHEGFERGKMPASEREAFFGSLVDCHAIAVKAGMRGLAVLPDASSAPRAEGFSLERAVVPAGDIQVEEIRLRGPSGGAVLNVFTRTGIWTNLARGTWVELADAQRGAWRARLTWISPNKGVYLFTNPASGRRALSISPEALAEKMRLGEARVIDATPLVGRAVGSMLEGLRGQG
jgi:uncharacterized protein DUF1631